MSSTGIREKRDSGRRILDNVIQNEENFIQSLRIFSNTSTLGGFGAAESSSIAPTAAGNFLEKTGDTKLGSLGNFPEITQIFNQSIDVSKETGATAPFIIINPAGDSRQNVLTTINVGENPYWFQELYIQVAGVGNTGQSLTIRDSQTGNIETLNGEDLVLPGRAIAFLIYESLQSRWRVISTTSGMSQKKIELKLSELEIDTIKSWEGFLIQDVGGIQLDGPPDVTNQNQFGQGTISSTTDFGRTTDAKQGIEFSLSRGEHFTFRKFNDTILEISKAEIDFKGTFIKNLAKIDFVSFSGRSTPNLNRHGATLEYNTRDDLFFHMEDERAEFLFYFGEDNFGDYQENWQITRDKLFGRWRKPNTTGARDSTIQSGIVFAENWLDFGVVYPHSSIDEETGRMWYDPVVRNFVFFRQYFDGTRLNDVKVELFDQKNVDEDIVLRNNLGNIDFFRIAGNDPPVPLPTRPAGYIIVKVKGVLSFIPYLQNS